MQGKNMTTKVKTVTIKLMKKVKKLKVSAASAKTGLNSRVKSRAKSRGSKKTQVAKELIVIDEKQGLIFENEKTLFGYFTPFINALEDEYQALRHADDFTDDEQNDHFNYLEATLDQPDEIWVDTDSFEEFPVYIMIKSYEESAGMFTYIACSYVEGDSQTPSFVFLHFPTRKKEMVNEYRRNECVYHRVYESVQVGALEGDALVEGDPVAIGLYQAMKIVRNEKDILEENFKDYANLREKAIESPDEIWRKVDINGHVLVTFILEAEDGPENLHYVVVTQEDPDSQVHSLLFSFPTTDDNLLDRYRQGENLQAEDVSQESSH